MGKGLQSPKSEKQVEELEPVLSSIMTAEEYARVEHASPYIFELNTRSKGLYYFGSPHTGEPSHSVFSEIEAAFNRANSDIVFVEGFHIKDKQRICDWLNGISREEAIEKMGESAFTVKLALEKGIDWHSPEPADEDLFNDLISEGFSKDEIFAHYVLHILPQYIRQKKKEGFEEYIKPYIQNFKRSTNWEGFDYSYGRAIKLAEQIVGRAIDIENDQNASDQIDPIPWKEKRETQTVLNEISRASSVFRDRNIVSDIVKTLKTHKCIFIVYSYSHAIMQEPALKKLFESGI